MSRYVWIGYTDYSEDKKELILDDQLVETDQVIKDNWLLNQLPLLIPPLVCLTIMYGIFGVYVLKMIFWIVFLFALLLGFLGLTKLYELRMYGFIGGRSHRLYRQLKEDRKSLDMKLGNVEMDVHFFENYEIRDKRLKHHLWGYLPQIIEVILYLLLYSNVFGMKLVVMTLMLTMPTLILIYGLVYLTRPKLTTTKA